MLIVLFAFFLFFAVFADGFLVALAAEWLILLRLAQQHPLVVLHLAMTDVGQRSASHADGVHLRHIVGNGAESRHRAERHPPEVHIQTCHDDADASVGQLVAYVDDAHVEELSLVDANYIDVARQ